MKSRRGQALIELLPALLVFMMVLSATMAYFKGMRFAALRQEVVRNLAFAQINNSGTLTTAGERSAGTGNSPAPLFFNRKASQITDDVISRNDMKFIDNQTNCFTVFPNNTKGSIGVTGIYGFDENPAPLDMSSYAVVYRGRLLQGPSGDCRY